MVYSSLLIFFNIIHMFQSVLSYTLLNKLPLGKGSADIESIEYDVTNDRYLVASWYEGTILPFTQNKITNTNYDVNNDSEWHVMFGVYPINIWRDSGVAQPPFNNTNAAWNISTWRPAGMEIVNNKLYVVDFDLGRLARFDIATSKYESSLFITNVAGLPANLDGLCHDPTSPNMLYTTDFGFAADEFGNFNPTGYEAVYAVNTDNWSWSPIYHTSTTVSGSNNGYTIRANGCVVVNGILYTVDFDMSHSQKQGFSQFVINNEQWSVEYDILPNTGGDGLVYIDEIETFFTTDIENGTLSKYTPSAGDNKFMVVYEGMNSPADMTYNPTARVLAIPEVYTGFVNFIELDDALFATTTEFFTTTEIIETTLQEKITTEKPDEIIIDAAGAIGFFVTCLMSLLLVLVV